MTDSTPMPWEQIAALTAERDAMQWDSYANTRMYDEQLRKAEAERDELRKANADLVDKYGHELAVVEAERDRYRDALVEISEGTMRPAHFVAAQALTPMEEET